MCEYNYDDVIDKIDSIQERLNKLIALIDLDTEIEIHAIAQLEREAAANAN